MESYEYQLILKIIPAIIFVGYLMLPQKRSRGGINPVPFFPVALMVVVYIFMMGFYPLDWTFDRPRYKNIFVYIHTYIYGWKDQGWIIYNRILKTILGNLWQGMFLITSALYCFCYCIFAKRVFSWRYAPYFLILAFSSLGFVNYGTNVLRGGLSLAFIFYAISEKRLVLKIMIAALALSFQQFGIILIGGYLAGRFIKENWPFELLWIGCFLLSFFNILDLSYFADVLDVTDTRAISYLDSNNDSYKTGFRLDFVAYSFLPLAIGYYYIRRLKINDFFYNNIYRAYLAINALWLLAIKIPYTDRVAYYSWCLIPLITIYPLINTPQKIRKPQLILNLIIAFYLIVGFVI